MKILPFLTIVLFLVSCSQARRDLPSERILSFTSHGTVVGYGVRIDAMYILTATHVLETCKNIDCIVDGKLLKDGDKRSQGEKSIIGAEGTGGFPHLQSPTLGESVYVLKYSASGLKRIDGKVTGINMDYIAYDSTLSGSYFTGAIEINLVFSGGESGLPVWSYSGELIGVVSATDERTGKSYIVQ